MVDTPAISVIMPLFRSQKYLRESIDSVINQTFSDFEYLIIVDDATDETASILNEYKNTDDRVRVFFNSNLGLVNSLNMGFAVARGTYIARMDSDDICFPSRLEKQYRYMEEHQEIGILGTSYEIIDGKGNRTHIFHPIKNPKLIKWRLVYDNCLTHSSVMIRRSIINETRYYRLDAKYAEDYDLWVRASLITNIANLHDVLMKYRVHDENVSATNVGPQEKTVREVLRTSFGSLLARDVPAEEIAYVRQFVRGNCLDDPGKLNTAIKILYDLYKAFICNNKLRASEIGLITNDLMVKMIKSAIKESRLPVSARAIIFSDAVALKICSYFIIMRQVHKS